MRNNELYHHGVKGMKWGVRRYQNKDGTLTSAGKKRLSITQTDGYRKVLNKAISNKHINKAAKTLTDKNMSRSRRKETINKQTDKDVRLGMKITKGSAEDVKKGLDAANKAIAAKKQRDEQYVKDVINRKKQINRGRKVVDDILSSAKNKMNNKSNRSKTPLEIAREERDRNSRPTIREERKRVGRYNI